MSEKTYVFDGGNSLSSLVPLLQNNGIDPNVLYAMNNNGFGGQGGWFMWIIFLALLWGRGGFGGYGNGDGTGFLASQLNNDYGRDVLLQAINGNGIAISQLATTLNCDINAVQAALTSLGTQIQSVGNTVGLSAQQIINAIQAGNCDSSKDKVRYESLKPNPAHFYPQAYSSSDISPLYPTKVY